MEPRILIISPVRNEAAHIERVVRAMAVQELLPESWIVIDDHSTDATLKILRALEPGLGFLRIAEHAPDPTAVRDRLAQAAEVRNFYAGLALAPHELSHYTHVMKLDGDIELPPQYLRVMMERFAGDGRIGLAGGVLQEPAPDGSMRPIRIPSNYVHGALKLYSGDCFAAIGGIQERLGWDTIDLTSARMHGFRTASFPELVSVHLRPLASADGVLRGRARHGECAWVTHAPPEWVLLRALKIATWHPRLASGAWYLYGYVRAAARRTERVPDPAFRAFSRRELRGRLRGAVIGRVRARRRANASPQIVAGPS
jgi:biofilm PGA synthesis N-glycosyltransferase PgaC